MKNIFVKTIGAAALAILMLIGFAQIWVSAQENKDSAETLSTKNEKGLVGSWNVQVTIRDCQTGAAQAGWRANVLLWQGGIECGPLWMLISVVVQLITQKFVWSGLGEQRQRVHDKHSIYEFIAELASW